MTKTERWYTLMAHSSITSEQIAASAGLGGGGYTASDVRTVVRNYCERHGLRVPEAAQRRQRGGPAEHLDRRNQR